MKSFDRAAGSYESFAHVQRDMAVWLAEWLPEDRSGTAIEVGAGTGVLTRHLMPWTGRLITTDASARMVARGQANCPEADWKMARADQLPNVSTDWIFSASFLQWATDPVALLRHWRAKLSARGRVLAGLFVAPTLHELYDVLPGSAPLHWRTPMEWQESFEAAGLRIIRAETSTCVFNFSSCLELLRNLHGVGAAPTRRVSPALLRQAMNDYDMRFGSSEGVRSTWEFYRIEATAEEKRTKGLPLTNADEKV